MISLLKKILPHVLIVLSVVLLVFLVIDQINSAMVFINNQATKIIMFVQVFVALLLAGVYIADSR